MKRKVFCKIASVVLAVAMFFSVSSLFPSFDSSADAKQITEADIKALRDKLAATKKKVSEYSVSSSSLNGEINDALEAKEKLDQQISYIQESVSQTEELIGYYSQMIDDKTETIELRAADIEEKYRAFGKFLRVSYENGQKSYIELLVSSSSLVDFLTRADNLGSMLKYQQSIVNELNDEINDLAKLKADLETKKSELEELRVVQQQSEAELKTQLSLQEKYVKELEKKLESDEKARKALLANQAALEKELQKTIKEYEKQQIAARNKLLLWPLPSEYRTISSKFGPRQLFGLPDNHLGIDIPAKYGTTVFAANDGKVLKSTYNGSYGYYILIDHGGGKCTLYAHMSSLLVSQGATVKRGQTIGKVGATGNAYGYHLHFEVRIDGKVTNPLVKNMILINYNGKDVDVTTSGVLKYS